MFLSDKQIHNIIFFLNADVSQENPVFDLNIKIFEFSVLEKIHSMNLVIWDDHAIAGFKKAKIYNLDCQIDFLGNRDISIANLGWQLNFENFLHMV